VAKLPATTVMTKMAHTSRPMSTSLPADVSGFLICDETVSSCTAEKKAASPNPWMSPPFCPLSSVHVSKVPAANTTIVSTKASTRRASSRRCRSSRVKSLDISSRITAGLLPHCAALPGRSGWGRALRRRVDGWVEVFILDRWSPIARFRRVGPAGSMSDFSGTRSAGLRGEVGRCGSTPGS